MCFSATASLTVAGVLFSAGVFSTLMARQINKQYLLFSLVPIFFAIQQGIEGLIWLKTNQPDVVSIHITGYIYLFFAFCFWPFYVPMSIYKIEQDSVKKKIMAGLVIAGLLLGILLYAPILFGWVPFTVVIVAHHLQYNAYTSAPLIWSYSVCYALVLILPLLISSLPRMNIFGIMLFMSLITSYLIYSYAFTSVWCFFSAALSGYIAYIIYQLRPLS